MTKKILIIGYGSIGEKHYKILKKLDFKSEILVFTNRKNTRVNSTNNINDLLNFNPNYIFVCSETSKHLNDVRFIDKSFKNKIVLIEKPVFHKNVKNKFKNNLYLVGYNLRFHPVLAFIKKILKKKNIFSVNIRCSSYLPEWRPNKDYRKSYSSNKKKGGGVLLDLSHELDYLQWLFGKITKINRFKVDKISKLKINVKDFALITGKINTIHFYINMNFFSRVNERSITIDAKDYSIKGDLLNFKVYLYDKKKTIFNLKKKNLITYLLQDKNILSKNFNNFCFLKEGLALIKLIKKIDNG